MSSPDLPDPTSPAPLSPLEDLAARLRRRPRRWLVTGCAGFIGSHLLEELLRLGQEVWGLDDFSTGHPRNLEEVRSLVGPEGWGRFHFLEGDLRDPEACREAVREVEFVLHHAALVSVPASLERPALAHAINVDGFQTLLEAARAVPCKRFVYASSSAVYGDEDTVPAREERIGAPLSPYAASKRINEIQAGLVSRCFGLPTAGLRYFNVMGPRQDPEGAYAAVIPRWTLQFLRGERPRIFGDGSTTRDFCPVADVVQANLRAALAPAELLGGVFNIGLGHATTLEELFVLVRDALAELGLACAEVRPIHAPFREGDVLHSCADIDRARTRLGFQPSIGIESGLRATVADFFRREREGGGLSSRPHR